ncbi:hypothetical protein LJD48_28130, partial [Escherichia coli]|nr:hypothetical protein [Escherichia coli]
MMNTGWLRKLRQASSQRPAGAAWIASGSDSSSTAATKWSISQLLSTAGARIRACVIQKIRLPSGFAQ